MEYLRTAQAKLWFFRLCSGERQKTDKSCTVQQHYISHIALRTFYQVHSVSQRHKDGLWSAYYFIKVMDVGQVGKATAEILHQNSLSGNREEMSSIIQRQLKRLRLTWRHCSKNNPKWDNRSLFQPKFQYCASECSFPNHLYKIKNCGSV